MNWERLERKWKQMGRSALNRWRKLTDELTFMDQQRDQLIGKIQTWYGIGKEEAEKHFNTWSQRVR
jgi:uncharacterized protein YjbJ (UPF0337 family)